MGKREYYIPITPPYSLDKNWDGADPTQPPGIMQELKNYVPEQDVLRTRKGITTFGFEEASWNPETDPNLVLWAKHESGALLNCAINHPVNGSALFTKQSGAGGNVSVDTVDYQEDGGSGDYDYAISDHYLNAPNASIKGVQSTFPGVVGGSKDFIITLWVKPDWQPPQLTTTTFIRKDPYGNAGTIVIGCRNPSGTNEFFFSIEDGNGLIPSVDSSIKMAKEWYHVGCWHNISLATMGLRIFRASNSTVYNYTAANPQADMGQSDSDYFNMGYGYFDGHLDDVMVFSDCPDNTTEIYSRIDTIRARGVDG